MKGAYNEKRKEEKAVVMYYEDDVRYIEELLSAYVQQL
jgi:hypothetical protein